MPTPKKKKKVSSTDTRIAQLKAEADQVKKYGTMLPRVESPLPPRNIPPALQNWLGAQDPLEFIDGDLAMDEFKNLDRTIPTEQIPQIAQLQKLVGSLVGVEPAFRELPPEQIATWGDETRNYNYGGVFRPAKPDRIGMEARGIAGLMSSPKYSPAWMEGVTTASNELAHYNQWLLMKGQLQHRHPDIADFNERWAPPLDIAFHRRNSGRYDDSPFSFNKLHQPTGIRSDIEYQSTLVGDTVRQAYKTEEQLGKFQQAAQTPQGQAAMKVLQNLAFDHFLGR